MYVREQNNPIELLLEQTIFQLLSIIYRKTVSTRLQITKVFKHILTGKLELN